MLRHVLPINNEQSKWRQDTRMRQIQLRYSRDREEIKKLAMPRHKMPWVTVSVLRGLRKPDCKSSAINRYDTIPTSGLLYISQLRSSKVRQADGGAKELANDDNFMASAITRFVLDLLSIQPRSISFEECIPEVRRAEVTSCTGTCLKNMRWLTHKVGDHIIDVVRFSKESVFAWFFTYW
jgi:hypothetical protein